MCNLLSRLHKFNIYDLLIFFLLIGILFSNYLWLKIDKYPVEGHELQDLTPAARAYIDLTSKGNTSKPGLFNILNDFLKAGHQRASSYGPLSFSILLLFYFLFGLQGQMAVMVNKNLVIYKRTKY